MHRLHSLKLPLKHKTNQLKQLCRRKQAGKIE